MSKEQLTIDSYIESRLKDQINYFGNKASGNKSLFMRYQRLIIVIGAIIPVLVVIDTITAQKGIQLFGLDNWSGIISAVLSAGVSVIAGFDKLQQPLNTWYNSRASQEFLKKEEFLFIYHAGPYAGLSDKEAERLLVERVENAISADIATFAQTKREEKKSGQNSDDISPVAKLLEDTVVNKVELTSEEKSQTDNPEITDVKKTKKNFKPHHHGKN